MYLQQFGSKCLGALRVAVVGVTLFQFSVGGAIAAARQAHDTHTRSPIEHVIVLIGENRTFDHIFATYVPKSEDSISNLLSKGIITAQIAAAMTLTK
jgi:phospholipase C